MSIARPDLLNGTTAGSASQTAVALAETCDGCGLLKHTLYETPFTAELAGLRAAPPVRLVPARQMIVHVGDVLDVIYSIRDGWACRFVLLPDGRRQILSIYLPGNLISFAALFGEPVWFAVQAISEMTLCAFDRSAFARHMLNDPTLLARCTDGIARRAARMDERLVGMGKRNAVERVARLILDIEAHFRNLEGIAADGSFPFLLRQEHIADLLGLTRVHVSRTWGTLKRDGVVATGEDRLVIRDRERLTKLSGLA